MPSNPQNPFNFTAANSLDDVLNQQTYDKFGQLQWQGVRTEKAVDFFYDALEAPGVNEDLKWQVADTVEHLVTTQAEKAINDIRSKGSVPANALASLQDWSQSSIRIVRIKGNSAHPLIRSIANQISVLPQAEHDSALSMAKAFIKAYNELTMPVFAPFNFHNAQSVDEIIYGSNETLKTLQEQGIRGAQVIDLFFDALESDGVNAALREEAVERLSATSVEQIIGDVKEYAQKGGDEWIKTQHPNIEGFWLNAVQTKVQQALRLARLQGKSADRTLQEVAKEISALSPGQRSSLSVMMQALTKACEEASKPVPVKRKPAGKVGYIAP